MNFSDSGPASFGAVNVNERTCTVFASLVNCGILKMPWADSHSTFSITNGLWPRKRTVLTVSAAGSDRTKLDDRRRDRHVGLDPRLDKDGNLARLVVGRQA